MLVCYHFIGQITLKSNPNINGVTNSTLPTIMEESMKACDNNPWYNIERIKPWDQLFSVLLEKEEERKRYKERRQNKYIWWFFSSYNSCIYLLYTKELEIYAFPLESSYMNWNRSLFFETKRLLNKGDI